MLNPLSANFTKWSNKSKRKCKELSLTSTTAQRMKFSIKEFFSQCYQIHRKLQMWSNLPKKSLMENFNFLCSALILLWNAIYISYPLKFRFKRSETLLILLHAFSCLDICINLEEEIIVGRSRIHQNKSWYYLGPLQTSKVDFSVKIVFSCRLLKFLWKLQLRCLTSSIRRFQ